jgi:hypothetical protein
MDDNQNVQASTGENDTPVILPVEEEAKELEETPAEEAAPEAPTEEVA